jgi:hypothetical protein
VVVLDLRLVFLPVKLLHLVVLFLPVRLLHLLLHLLQLGLQFHTVVKFIVSCVWGVPFRVEVVFLTYFSPSTANGDNTKCLTVGGGAAADGTVVNMYEEFFPNTFFPCFHSTYPRIPFAFSSPSAECFPGAPTDGFNLLQRWDVVYGSTKVKLHGTNYCLDAG